MRSRVSSVNQEADFFGHLVLVETGATESRSKISMEFTSFVRLSTGFVKVAKGARTPGTLSLSAAVIAGLIRREVKTFV